MTIELGWSSFVYLYLGTSLLVLLCCVELMCGLKRFFACFLYSFALSIFWLPILVFLMCDELIFTVKLYYWKRIETDVESRKG